MGLSFGVADTRTLPRGRGVVRENSVHAERAIARDLGREVAVRPAPAGGAEVRRQEGVFGAERPGVHEKPARVRLGHEPGRLAERAVGPATDEERLRHSDALRVRGDFGEVEGLARKELHEAKLRQAGELAQALRLERLEDGLRFAAAVAVRLQERDHTRLERKAEGLEVPRMLELRVDADFTPFLARGRVIARLAFPLRVLLREEPQDVLECRDGIAPVVARARGPPDRKSVAEA